MSLNFGSLQGYDVNSATLIDAVKCIVISNRSRSVLHYELAHTEVIDKNKLQYISEYMREQRYWNFLAVSIMKKLLLEKSEKSGKCLYLTYSDIEELMHGLMSYSKNDESAELLEKLDALQKEYEDEEYLFRLKAGDIERELE